MNCKILFNNEINRKILDLCPPETKIYLVGGYIRDIFLNKPCYDRDYMVIGQSAVEFARKVAVFFDGYFILLDKEHDIARVVMPDKKNMLDFAGCVGQDVYSDLANRDYTLNALACQLQKDEYALIDPFNGCEDIKNNLIKMISEENLVNDPLRLLRAFRLSAQFGFDIEENTINAIKKHYKLIGNVAFERINTELVKLLEAENSAKSLAIMKDTGLLFEIFPELAPQQKVPPNTHHHLWLIDHSIETVRQIEINLKNFPDWAKEHINRDFSQTIRAISLLKTAALLHDLGKPATWTIENDGRHRFIKHEEVGAELVLEPLKRLKFSKNAIKYINMLIKNHLYPSQLIREGVDKISDKALMRFFRRISDNTPELLLLALGDRLSAQGPQVTGDVTEKNISGIYALLDRYKDSAEEARTLPKLVSGNEIMEMLDIPRGPKVGRLLAALREEQVSGNINTRKEAIEFIKRYS